MEYLVTMTTHVPEGTPDQAVEDVRGREAGPAQTR
jgi:muconolactone D-isomerase